MAKLVMGPDLKEARRFAKELGPDWEGRLFGQHYGSRFDFVVIIQAERIKLMWHPENLRVYIWESVKTLMNPGCERNIRIL